MQQARLAQLAPTVGGSARSATVAGRERRAERIYGRLHVNHDNTCNESSILGARHAPLLVHILYLTL